MALTAVDDVHVVRTAGWETKLTNAFGVSYAVTFVGEFGPQELLMVRDDAVTGAYATVFVVSTVDGVTPAGYMAKTVDSVSRSTVLTGLTQGTSYSVNVKAVNAKGSSAPRFAGAETPRTVSGPAIDATLLVMSAAQIRMRWSRPCGRGRRHHHELQGGVGHSGYLRQRRLRRHF